MVPRLRSLESFDGPALRMLRSYDVHVIDGYDQPPPISVDFFPRGSIR